MLSDIFLPGGAFEKANAPYRLSWVLNGVTVRACKSYAKECDIIITIKYRNVTIRLQARGDKLSGKSGQPSRFS
jgi:hypothetical protein